MDIQQLKSYSVLLIGDSCEDVYHYGFCERLSPEAPVPIIKQTEVKILKGMSWNVRLNLEAYGVFVNHLTNEETLKKHRFIDLRHNQHLLRWDEGEQKKLKQFDIRYLATYQNIDAVIISDYNKGFLTNEICYKIIEYFKKNKPNIPIFVDTKKTDVSCYGDCYIKINEKEFENIVNASEKAEFIVTLGDKGALYKNKKYETEAVEVFDVCGAGDVFLASLVAGYLHYGNIEKAIPLANKMAAISVSHMGTYVLNEDDICGK